MWQILFLMLEELNMNFYLLSSLFLQYGEYENYNCNP